MTGIIKTSLLFLLFAFAIPLPLRAQKAFEAVYYTGRTQNITIRFAYADGYLQGCEIKTTDNKTRKTSRFLPEGDGAPGADKQMKFYHAAAKGGSFTDYFILDGIEASYDKLPDSFGGRYYFNGVGYSFTLKRSQ